jgi:hypothetical protein
MRGAGKVASDSRVNSRLQSTFELACKKPPTPQPSRLGSMLRRRQQIVYWHFDSPLDCNSLACFSLVPKRRRCDS